MAMYIVDTAMIDYQPIIEGNELYSWMRESVEDSGLDVKYCDMCDVNHENNTNCQWSD